MRRRVGTSVTRLILALVLSSAFMALPARAGAGGESGAPSEKDSKTSSTQTSMAGETGKRLSAAQEALEAQRYDEARAILAWLNPTRLSPYESARVEQMFAALDQAEGRYAAAQQHLDNAIASGGLSDEEMSTVRYEIAQLYLARELWRDGADALEAWLARATDPQPVAYYLLGIAYYQLADFDAAVVPAQKTVDLAESPQENWMQLLLALRIAREEYPLAIPILQKLLERFPDKKTYWLQLSSVNAAVGDYADAAVVLQVAQTAGLLTDEQDVRRLTELLAHVGIPYRGGRLLAGAIEEKSQLQSDVKAYELLGNCWIAAREYGKAVAPLQRAAELAETGDIYVRLAQVEVQLENWTKAGDALQLAIDKGKLSNPANAQLLLGIAYYSQQKFDEAQPWFERAREDASYRAQAEGWIKQIAIDRSTRS